MRYPHLKNQRGSLLISAAVSAAILSILVGGLMTYMTNEARLNYRSHHWTQALHLAEAAVEMSLAEFNFQYEQGANGFQSARGWTSLGGGSYTRSVTVSNSLNQVIGTAQITISNVGGASPQIDGVGTTTAVEFGGSVSRAVRVKLATSSKFPVGLMSKNDIDLNGNNMYSDSFDSSDPSKSTGGQYDSTKKQANGDVATNSGVINGLSIGNADIYGRAYTGPGGSVTIGPNGSVGPTFVSGDRAATVAAGTTSGWIRDDFAVDVSDVSLPSGLSSAATVPGGSVNNNMTISGGDWKASSISLSGNKTLTITGTVRLYVTGSTSISGNGQITIASGGSLEVYCADSISLSGNGVVNNNSPNKNQWNGLPTCTSVSISGNGDLIGTVYAPNASMTVSGNGTVQGALVADNMTFSGNANLHYDESLKTSGGSAGYAVATWQELRYSSGSWVTN